ncbi:MAG: DNA primase [Candidatus Magasanikbacteria bacterium]|nr:DNA primase [Candidatus Magasanikbacteria bacterium]NCS71752.1 DNA primase [Candidatus Magasanikbacteria bacterium]
MSDDTQAIKDRIDIAEFIGEYVQLKPAGVNMKGLCPFHNEKSPSFMVNRDRQTFKCFGCSKGGDIFTFIQEIEGMEFIEALKLLANRAGVEIKQQTAQVNSNQKNRIKDINLHAARFFYNFLTQMDAAKEARDYLTTRGITQDMIDAWQIGFIPDQWELLTQYLLKKGHGVEDLVAAGITIKRDNANAQTGKGFYDRFRGRIMFPIRDVHGNVAGFTGRVLKETEHSGGKYVNTPQTIVYDKSRIVFGLDKARQEIRTTGNIVMVEGQMDVIAAHQAGMKNVVATSGTALTQEQIKLLMRYAKNMSMAFDADDAGEKAAKRGIALAMETGMHVKVIQIPEGKGKDPDECIKQNKEVWFTAVEHAQDIMEWYIERALINKDLKNPHDKQQIADEILPEIIRLPYAVEREHWLQMLAQQLSIDTKVLHEDIDRIKATTTQKTGQTMLQEEPQKSAQKQDKLEVLIEKWIGLGLRFPDIFQHHVDMLSHILPQTTYGPLYEQIKNSYTQSSRINLETLRQDAAQAHNPENIVDVLLMKSEWEFSDIKEDTVEAQLIEFSGHILIHWVKQRRQQLEQEIRKAEQHGDTERLNELLQQFQQLQS